MSQSKVPTHPIFSARYPMFTFLTITDNETKKQSGVRLQTVIDKLQRIYDSLYWQEKLEEQNVKMSEHHYPLAYIDNIEDRMEEMAKWLKKENEAHRTLNAIREARRVNRRRGEGIHHAGEREKG